MSLKVLNIAVKTEDINAIKNILLEKHEAYIAPAVNGWVSIFPNFSVEKFDILAAKLSKDLNTVAINNELYDQFLDFRIYDKGDCVFQFGVGLDEEDKPSLKIGSLEIFNEYISKPLSADEFNKIFLEMKKDYYTDENNQKKFEEYFDAEECFTKILNTLDVPEFLGYEDFYMIDQSLKKHPEFLKDLPQFTYLKSKNTSTFEDRVKNRYKDNPEIGQKIIDSIEKGRKRYEKLREVAETKYFIKLLITSYDSLDKNKERYLTLIMHEGEKPDNLNKVMNYCSKVNPGEKLQEVIEREITEISGNPFYRCLNIEDDGFAKDKFGNDLKRLRLVIKIPYFEPKGKKVIGLNLSWVEVDKFASIFE
jgi:hypothetical protein